MRFIKNVTGIEASRLTGPARLLIGFIIAIAGPALAFESMIN